jgi:hypothetical protein
VGEIAVNEQAKGHGHVTPNPNGDKARCGGPKICKVCMAELAALKAQQVGAALEAERVAFEAKHEGFDLAREAFSGEYFNQALKLRWQGWQARAQLAAPAGVSDLDWAMHLLSDRWPESYELVEVEVFADWLRELLAAAPSPAPASEVWMITTVKQLEQALDSVPSFHDLSAELIAPAMLEHLRSVITTGEYGDPYQGAREDLAIWKRRALEAETKIREQDQIIENLGNALNAENGPTFMGEPVLKPASADHVEEARHMVSGVPVYQLQCREIGEGDWCPADLRHYTYCQKSPEMDTRIVEVEPASDVVQVPRELLERIVSVYFNSIIDAAYWTDADVEMHTLRALLNGGRV